MPKKNMTFEQALSQLEKLVNDLEVGELSLEDSLKAYEQGVALSTFCAKTLEAAQLKISELQPEKDAEQDTEEDEDDLLLF